jgi:hypothetical protein
MHTREIADLKNAGLNPILSAKNSGAPTGAGAMAQAPDYSKAYGSGVAIKFRLKFSLILAIFNDSGFGISFTSLSNHKSISNTRAIGFGIIRSLRSLADFDYYFLFVGWWQYAAAAASALASVYGAKKEIIIKISK